MEYRWTEYTQEGKIIIIYTKPFRGGSLMVWDAISFGWYYPHVHIIGLMTAQCYLEEALKRHVQLFPWSIRLGLHTVMIMLIYSLQQSAKSSWKDPVLQCWNGNPTAQISTHLSNVGYPGLEGLSMITSANIIGSNAWCTSGRMAEHSIDSYQPLRDVYEMENCNLDYSKSWAHPQPTTARLSMDPCIVS